MKTLIVYYSLEGNTAYAADRIAYLTGADTLRINPVKEYPRDGFRKFLWGGKSALMSETPKLEAYIFDQVKYDRIIFGFPVWAGSITPPIRTFIRENDLKGKHIAAFACQSGSGAENGSCVRRRSTGSRFSSGKIQQFRYSRRHRCILRTGISPAMTWC